MNRWLDKAKSAVRDVLAMFLALRDPHVPFAAKAFAIGSIIYVFAPVDLIPDFIPILGWLDDMAALPLAAYLARRYTPVESSVNLRFQADALLRRWGSKFVWGAGIFLFFWLMLGSVAAWRMWQNRTAIRDTVGPAYAVPDRLGQLSPEAMRRLSAIDADEK
ncbi:MAG: DUF1232 domain-containing protein [Planctomycetes bacterium]|nr:DUF1232 domain-containing protein [Planctomycetota bacterium]